MTSIDNRKLIEIADLIRKVPNDDADADRLDGELKALTSQELVLVMLAKKLRDGRHYRITSDNPDHIRQVKALAQEIGATWEEMTGELFMGVDVPGTSLLFHPPGWE
jgi:hypothetical protein